MHVAARAYVTLALFGTLAPTCLFLALIGCAQVETLPNGWEFFQGKDSPYGDLNISATLADDWGGLTAACSVLPGCLAVNTNGVMKGSLKPVSAWETWSSEACKGLLVKGEG